MSTQVLLLRHGEPFPGENGALTPEGHKRVKEQAALFKRAGLHPARIFYSPLKRTKETAEEVANLLLAPLEEAKELEAKQNVLKILNLLPHPLQNETVFLVGHAPSLLSFYESALALPKPLALHKGSAILLSFDTDLLFGSASLLAYYP